MANKKCYHLKCCCKCEFQQRVRKHPCNIKLGKGSMRKTFGYVCDGLEKSQGCKNALIFFDNRHMVGCEIHTPKKKRKSK